MDNDKGAAAKFEWRRNPWYTGPDPYKDMEVLIMHGSAKAFQGRIQSSKVDQQGQWLVLVEQTTTIVRVSPSWMKISEVVEL